MVKKTDRKMERRRRHIRVRRKVSGTAERPRLCVYRSNANIYAQIIDDVAGNTLVQASTLDKEIKIKRSQGLDLSSVLSQSALFYYFGNVCDNYLLSRHPKSEKV
mgnify:CR=1 FL=1